MPNASLLLVTVGNVSTAAAQWYLVWFLARQDGPHAVGQYSTLIAILAPVYILSQLGLRNLYLTLQRRIRWRVYLGVRLSTAVIATAVGLMAIHVLNADVDWRMAFAVLVIKISDTIGDLFFARLQRAERLTAFGLILIFSALVSAGVVTVIMVSTGLVVAALWGVAGTAAAGAVVTAHLGIRASAPGPDSAQAPAPRPVHAPQLAPEARALLAAGLPLSLMQGIYSLMSYTPLGVVALFGSADEVGQYASAAYLVVFANLVGASLETVVLPDYRRHYDTAGPTSVLRAARVRGLIVMGLLTPMIILALFVGSPLLSAIYGDEFALSRPAIGMLSLAAVITVPTYLLSATLLVLNRYWATTWVGAFAVFVALGSGWVAGALGLPAVEAGCLALLCGSLGRYGGELVLASLPARPGAHPRAVGQEDAVTAESGPRTIRNTGPTG